jgi:iron-sulfur cluster assembly accessory protein
VTGIILTNRAIEAALELQRDNAEFQNCVLRLYIDGKGCDGFYYGVTFTSADEDDVSVLDQPITVVIDKKSLEYMRDSVVDWVDDTRGKGFLVSNPHHIKFRGKFFKRQSWQEKLSSSSQSTT